VLGLCVDESRESVYAYYQNRERKEAKMPARRFLKPWMWRVLDTLGAWPFSVQAGPARGLSIYTPLRRRNYYTGNHEPHVLAAVAAVVQPGMVACDVGSYLGYFMLALAALVGPTGRVYAFEPLPKHTQLLQKTVTRNRLTQVMLVPRAVGSETGSAVLEEGANPSMTRLADGTASGRIHRYTVPVTTLDDWAEKAHPPRLDLIKLDIEGYELAALQGAARVLAQYRPVVLCEVHRGVDVPYQPSELVAWLQAAGYRVDLIPPPQRTSETLAEALARLHETQPLPGQMYIAHLLARPATR
jgi:FkbM family methyltransferase